MKKKDRIWIYLLYTIGILLMSLNVSFKSIGQVSSTTVKDIDGNEYKTVRIATQTWMAENLKTTKYNDGKAIPLVPDNNERSMLKTGAYCYSADFATGASINLLYNWYVVNTEKICPTGWHVPSDTEWDTLVIYLGGADVAGGKLKEADTIHWCAPNYGANNSSGFTALPDIVRTKGFKGMIGVWWSSTELNESNAWFRSLTSKIGGIVRWNYSKAADSSIRCLKD